MVTQPHYQPSKLKAVPRQQRRQVSSADVIACGISTLFHNKENRAEPKFNRKTGETSNKWAFGFSFYPQSITVDNLVKHALKGGAFTCGYFQGNTRTKKTFISSQVLALDYDNTDSRKEPDGTITEFCRADGYASYEDICNDPFVKQYAFLVYPSASSKEGWDKTRVLFALSEPVTSAARWEAIQRGLMQLFAHWHPDKACKDAPHFYYGSTNRIHTPLINPAARLPIEIAGGLTLADAVEYDTLRGNGEQLPTVELTGTRREKYAQAALDRIADEIAGAVASRHNAIMAGATALFSRAAGGWFSYSDAENAIRQACSTNGYTAAKGMNEVQRLIDDARRYGQSNPKALTVPADDKKKSKRRRKHDSSTADLDATDTRLEWKPVALATLEGAETVHVQWLNQVDLTGTDDLLIKSDTGTGKTTAIAALIASGQRVLIVTHRRSLAKTLAKTFDAENYETLKGGDYTKPTRLVVCVNSLHKLAASGQLPAYDVIIIDEIAQVLTHLNSRTFKKPNEAQNAYNVLRVLVQHTARFIGMDAYLNPISIAFVKGLRQGRTIRIIENTYTRQKNALTVYAESETMLQTAVGIVQENSGKPVVLFFGSARELRDKERYFVELVGRENVISIYQDTPNPKAQQHFINHINTEINKYKVVLCSPTIGSGVDIQTPVRAAFGFYQHEPLTATDIHQQLNRCRHTPETHVYIRNIPGERETNPQTLFTETWEKAAKTGAYCEYTESGRQTFTPAQQALLRLLSQVQADDNTSKNNLYAHFMTLAVGYSSITYNTTAAPDSIKDTLKANRAAIAASDKALVLAADPVTHQEYDALLDKSEQTAETIAGYERWKIEQAAGVEITPELYDRLHKSDDRAALRLLARIRFADAGEMKALDRAQIPYERLNHLQHHYQKWKVLNALLVGMFGSIGGITPDKVFTAEEIADLLDRVIGTEDLRLFGKRKRESRPVTVLRFLLKQIGLKLATVGRSQAYSLDADQWTIMDPLSITSRQRMELDALQQQQKADEKRGVDQPDYAKIGRIYIQNLPKIADTAESDGAADQTQKRYQSATKVLPEISAIVDGDTAPELTPIGVKMASTDAKTSTIGGQKPAPSKPLHLPTKGSGSSINPFSLGFNPAAVEQISAYNRQNNKADNLGVPKSIGGKEALAARLKGVKRCETL